MLKSIKKRYYAYRYKKEMNKPYKTTNFNKVEKYYQGWKRMIKN